MRRGGAPGLGVLLIKNSTWSNDLLHKLWNMDELKYRRSGWENGAFIDYFGLVGLMGPEERKVLYKDDKFSEPQFELLKKIRWLSPEWHHWYWFTKKTKNPIVNHYSIAPYGLRLFLMSKDAYKTSLISMGELIRNMFFSFFIMCKFLLKI